MAQRLGMMPRHAVLAVLLAAAALAGACAHGGGPADLATLTSNSDQVIWEAGQKALKKKDYEAARQHFKRIVEAFPQSEYAPLSRLAVGDAHFQEAAPPLDHGHRRLPRVPDPLPSHPRATTRSSRWRGFQQRKDRPRPDADQHAPASTSGCWTPSLRPPWPRRPGLGSRNAARAWRGRSSWPGTSTSGRGRPAAPPCPGTRRCSRATRTMHAPTRCCSGWRSVSSSRVGRPRRSPSSAVSSRTIPEASTPRTPSG